MRTLSSVLLALIGCGGACTPEPDLQPEGPAAPPAEQPPRSAATGGGGGFDTALYRELASGDGNVFVSPASVQLALGMTLAGARGETADEMERALSLEGDDALGVLGARYQSWSTHSGPGELGVANRVWVAEGLTLDPDYTARIDAHFRAGIAPARFSEPEEARAEINGWVADKTHDRIEELLAPDAIDQATTMVLTNAIYFLGHWTDAFDPEATAAAPFHKADGSTAEVMLMARTGRYAWAEADSVKLLSLPYEGERFSMLVVLPSEGTPLSEVESRLGAEQLASWRAALRTSELRVHLPRFEVETSYDLVPPLKALGMERAFTGHADFSGMGAGGQAISAIVHKAFVRVDEQGTEAAAATAVVMTRSARLPPPVFRADRPFLYVIWDAETEAPLFLGRLSEP